MILGKNKIKLERKNKIFFIEFKDFVYKNVKFEYLLIVLEFIQLYFYWTGTQNQCVKVSERYRIKFCF